MRRPGHAIRPSQGPDVRDSISRRRTGPRAMTAGSRQPAARPAGRRIANQRRLCTRMRIVFALPWQTERPSFVTAVLTPAQATGDLAALGASDVENALNTTQSIGGSGAAAI